MSNWFWESLGQQDPASIVERLFVGSSEESIFVEIVPRGLSASLYRMGARSMRVRRGVTPAELEGLHAYLSSGGERPKLSHIEFLLKRAPKKRKKKKKKKPRRRKGPTSLGGMLRQLPQVLSAAYRAHEGAPVGDPGRREATGDLYQAITRLLAQIGDLVLAVTEDGIWAHGKHVAGPDDAESIGRRLWNGGVRGLSFERGLDRGEVERFLEVWSGAALRGTAPDESVATRLWEAELDGIYVLVPRLESIPVPPEEPKEETDAGAPDTGRFDPSRSTDMSSMRSGRIRAPSGRENDREGSHRTAGMARSGRIPAAGRAREASRPTPSLANFSKADLPYVKRTKLPPRAPCDIAEEKLAAFSREFKAELDEFETGLGARTLRLMRVLFRKDELSPDVYLSWLEETFLSEIRTGNLSSIASAAASIRLSFLRHGGGGSFLEQFEELLVRPEILERISVQIDGGRVSESAWLEYLSLLEKEARATLVANFELFSPGPHRQALLEELLTLVDERLSLFEPLVEQLDAQEARIVLDELETAGPEADPLRRGLAGRGDHQIATYALLALAEPSAEELEAIGQRLSSEDEALRTAALEALVRGNEAGPLLRHAGEKAFSKRPEAWRLRVLRALAEVGGEEVFSFLLETIGPRSGWRLRDDSDFRMAAIRNLKGLSNKMTVRLLVEIAESKDDKLGPVAKKVLYELYKEQGKVGLKWAKS